MVVVVVAEEREAVVHTHLSSMVGGCGGTTSTFDFVLDPSISFDLPVSCAHTYIKRHKGTSSSSIDLNSLTLFPVQDGYSIRLLSSSRQAQLFTTTILHT